jgi:hypothetical protein
VLLGWASREAIVGAHRELVTTNGLFRPFMMVRGRAVGIWGLARGEVTMTAFGRLGRADRQALERDAVDVVRFLGG